MRCPRCGYISFDQISNCLRCGKDIKKASRELDGAVSNIAAPGYLAFAQEEAARAQAESKANEKAEQVVAALPDDDFFLDDSGDAAEEGGEEISFVESLGEEGVEGDEIENGGASPSSQISLKKEGQSASSDKDFTLDLGELGLSLDKEDTQ